MYYEIFSYTLTQSQLNFLFFRIRKERKGGAWCPKEMIDKYSYEYLQIDLDKLMVITKVETQGRFGNGLVGFCSRRRNHFGRLMLFYH
jgi:hypothetical protein